MSSNSRNGIVDAQSDTLAPTTPRRPVPSAPAAPRSDERYVRHVVHDQGGMGRIWKARDVGLEREVALKELHPELATNPIAMARFIREALITGQLEHPGVVPVYELAFSNDGRQPYYAMRFMKGRTLADAAQDYHLKRADGQDTSLEQAALLHAFVTVCNTVGFAHSRGVIHRDLKGQNVLLGDFGEVVVLDWGLAKRLGVPELRVDAEAGPGDDNPSLTMHGETLGTPACMAPEQAAGLHDQIDHRTDIYGLGALLYEILTGKQPFAGESTMEVIRRVLGEEPVPPRHHRPDVPPVLEEVCLRALAKKPADRFAAAIELAAAVQQWQDNERRQAEQALRASEEKYHMLADMIPGIIWTARPDGWVDFANQYWFKYTGLTMAQTEGSAWADVIHPDDLPRVLQLWAQSLKSGHPIEVEYRVRRARDGAYRWFLAQARAWRQRDGRIVKWFGMLTDIEEQKRALEKQNALVRLLHQVTVAAYEATSLEEALQAGLDHVCQYTGWPVGHVYLIDGVEMVPTSIWHLQSPENFAGFVQITSATPLRAGEGLPGRVFADRKPHWIMDVTRDTNFPRAKAAAHLGVKGAFGFPVLTQAGVVAVLEFFTSEPQEPDEVLLGIMAQIGLQLGQVFERRRQGNQ